MIRFLSADVPFDLKNKRGSGKWVKSVIESHGKKMSDINVVFCSDGYLLNMNKHFLKHNYYTDIITFDYCEGLLISGELYISIDTVRINASEYGQPFLRELYRVIIHGVLHLLGYDDATEMQTAKIHEEEDAALAFAGDLLIDTANE
ncbi:MAG: rRNA maturation RNase YbeY [Bacteroidales bacterium]|jgi:rRNA maturation RNase YbeY|nr:rRNA maturation RNase YbeY [Bacteroidales bacterium]